MASFDGSQPRSIPRVASQRSFVAAMTYEAKVRAKAEKRRMSTLPVIAGGEGHKDEPIALGALPGPVVRIPDDEDGLVIPGDEVSRRLIDELEDKELGRVSTKAQLTRAINGKMLVVDGLDATIRLTSSPEVRDRARRRQAEKRSPLLSRVAESTMLQCPGCFTDVPACIFIPHTKDCAQLGLAGASTVTYMFVCKTTTEQDVASAQKSASRSRRGRERDGSHRHGGDGGGKTGAGAGAGAGASAGGGPDDDDDGDGEGVRVLFSDSRGSPPPDSSFGSMGDLHATYASGGSPTALSFVGPPAPFEVTQSQMAQFLPSRLRYKHHVVGMEESYPAVHHGRGETRQVCSCGVHCRSEAHRRFHFETALRAELFPHSALGFGTCGVIGWLPKPGVKYAGRYGAPRVCGCGRVLNSERAFAAHTEARRRDRAKRKRRAARHSRIVFTITEGSREVSTSGLELLRAREAEAEAEEAAAVEKELADLKGAKPDKDADPAVGAFAKLESQAAGGLLGGLGAGIPRPDGPVELPGGLGAIEV